VDVDAGTSPDINSAGGTGGGGADEDGGARANGSVD
jgi:hypothetical protein